MTRLKELVLISEPSLLGGTVVAAASGLILILVNFSYLLKSGFIFDFLFGRGSPYQLIQNSRDFASTLNQTVFGNPTLNKLLFFGFWMMIGLFAYVTIMAISQSISETDADLKSLGYIHARKTLIERNLVVRIAVRLGGILAAAIYGFVLVRFLFPFAIFASRVGFGQLDTVSGWIYALIGFIVLALGLHIAVIIARLVMLRPRLFGGWDSLLLDTK